MAVPAIEGDDLADSPGEGDVPRLQAGVGIGGRELDRALAEGTARRDYTLLEHARDLAGAARWNAAPLVRRFTRVGRR